MAINIPRGTSDDVIDHIIEALRAYEADHPEARIDIYRQNQVSVRVRIIDRSFAGRSKVERSDRVWRYLDRLSDDDQSDISALILLAPHETSLSLSNLEFDHPPPSRL